MPEFEQVSNEINDISDLPAVEVIGRYAVELLSVAALQCGLADRRRLNQVFISAVGMNPAAWQTENSV